MLKLLGILKELSKYLYTYLFVCLFVCLFVFMSTDQSCSKFYGPDKHSPLKLGVCEVGLRSCKCTQGEGY